MRVLRIAPARQLALFAGRAGSGTGCWDRLPDQARGEVLALLARMIARSVLAGEDQGAGRPGGEAARGD